MLKRLNEVNDVKIYSVFDEVFSEYGRVIEGYDFSEMTEYMLNKTDFCLVLGHVWQIKDNIFTVGDEKVFYVPKGTSVELFGTTLHLSPCRVNDEGFKDIVILPKGTNTPLSDKSFERKGENILLLQKNKWVISHPDREPLIKQGAFPGLSGENKELKY